MSEEKKTPSNKEVIKEILPKLTLSVMMLECMLRMEKKDTSKTTDFLTYLKTLEK